MGAECFRWAKAVEGHTLSVESSTKARAKSIMWCRLHWVTLVIMRVDAQTLEPHK